MKFSYKSIATTMENKTLIIAGITRSGLTATMQMLNAGGYPCYGEYPSFKKAQVGNIPFKDLDGKAIKVVDTHIQIPPFNGKYHVILLRRNYKEQAKSIVKFLKMVYKIPVGEKGCNMIEQSLVADWIRIHEWAKKQKSLLILDFETIINSPEKTAKTISAFLDKELDEAKMAAVIKKRSTDCYPTMMEVEFFN